MTEEDALLPSEKEGKADENNEKQEREGRKSVDARPDTAEKNTKRASKQKGQSCGIEDIEGDEECFVDGKKVRENIRNSGCYKPNAQNPWKMLLGKMPDCAKKENQPPVRAIHALRSVRPLIVI